MNNKYDIKNFTREEKISLFVGKNEWSNFDFGKIYSFRLSDGPVGIRKPVNPKLWGGEIVKSVAYPSTFNLANTWDPELAYKMGVALGNDCIDHDIDILLGPGINIKRTPINGRNFEYYSEDPIIAGYMSKAYIEGVQSMHVGTSLKHFCCNNRELCRRFISSEVDQRTLRELYLKPFEIALEARPWSVMSSYNRVNGVHMSQNKEMIDLLRNELGFDGLIMSDWAAVHQPIEAIKAGTNLEMPFNEQHLKTLLESDIPSEIIDQNAQHVLNFVEKCENEKNLRKCTLTLDERIQISKEIAINSFVLLKNKDNILPLEPKNTKQILVTGDPCFQLYAGGGSSMVNPNEDYETLPDALRKIGFNVVDCQTVFYPTGNERSSGDFYYAAEESKKSDVCIIGIGNHFTAESEERDRYDIKPTHEDIELINTLASVGAKIVLIVYAGGVVDLSEIEDKVSGIIYAGFAGQRVSEALSLLISGKENPRGRLTETFPMCLEDVPEQKAYHDGFKFEYSEGIYVGYRYYETNNIPVRYPFGFGLSYSKFTYSDLSILHNNEQTLVKFKIKNTSSVDGYEVAQVYISDLTSVTDHPNRELKQFKKVFIPANEEVEVSLLLDRKSFSYFSPIDNCWRIDEGSFEIQVGKSSNEIILSSEITVKGEMLV